MLPECLQKAKGGTPFCCKIASIRPCPNTRPLLNFVTFRKYAKVVSLHIVDLRRSQFYMIQILSAQDFTVDGIICLPSVAYLYCCDLFPWKKCCQVWIQLFLCILAYISGKIVNTFWRRKGAPSLVLWSICCTCLWHELAGKCFLATGILTVSEASGMPLNFLLL